MTKEGKTKLIEEMKGIFKYISVDVLEFSIRTGNILKMAKVETLGDLTRKNEEQFLKIYGCGRCTLNEIKYQMERYGLSFGMQWPDYNWNDERTFFERLDALND